MTETEAIKTLVEIREKFRGNTVEEERKRIALNLAASALDMRRPMKPDITFDEFEDGTVFDDEWECQSCYSFFDIGKRTKYRPNCGQALLWEE
jgi:hypothetical protein